MPFTLLLAMQAAGMVTDLFGTYSQSKMLGLANEAQQAGIEANIAQTRVQAQDESLQAMRQLRTTMGSQIATMAARGTSTGAGSALSILNSDIGTFNEDEKVRRLNLLGKENQLRAGSAMSNLQYSSDVSKLWSSFATRSINSFPSSLSGWSSMGKSGSQGFGLTSIGS
jgi:hypothetical protein